MLTYFCSLIGNLISNTKKSVTRALGYLKPVIDERKAKMAEYGEDWEDKPVCPLSPNFCGCQVLSRPPE